MGVDLATTGALIGAVRFLALFMVAPFFGHSAIPGRTRMAFAVWVAIGLGSLSPASPAAVTAAGLPALIFSEALIGFALGFGVRLVVASFAMMGELVSIQGGLGAATVLDPTSNASTVALASLANVFALLLFMAIGGDHALLKALALSIERIPIGTAGWSTETWLGVASMGGILFEVAVRLAMPITVSMLLANLAVGILGRMIPQLNLMTVQLPALLALTLFLLAMGSVPFIEVMGTVIEDGIERSMMNVMGAR